MRYLLDSQSAKLHNITKLRRATIYRVATFILTTNPFFRLDMTS